ncbi:CBS domain-containing protein [Clostridium sp. MB40-C1]|uniref:CBS domain-containing protein n=1 Tax=Clostridium sp. MB40-C1 TaxID=3070996 RepID=UPI0027E092CE|nr:CBS domain-containing protein [Clostridium sp. MB40-C1]WMJ79633.1 CBS domain-containing protein [Clostridium sp. MB40-C1]
MLVSNLLLGKEKLTTISPYECIKEALELINKNKTLSIPVCIGDKFYGYIAKVNIYEFLLEKVEDRENLMLNTQVEELMKTDVPIVRPNEELEDVTPLLAKRNIPFVGVVDKYNKFHGIITYKAIFHEFTEILGVNQGRKMSIITHEYKGQISKITKIIAQNKGDVISIVVFNPKSAFNLREIVVRIEEENFDIILKKLKEAGFNVEI